MLFSFNRFSVSAVVIACGVFTYPVAADSGLGDMLIYVDSGRLITGHYDFDGGTGIVTDPGPTLVYVTELEADWEGGGAPGVDEPGIATDGSSPGDPDGALYVFPGNTALTATANVLPVLGVNAGFWDGSGAVSFVTSPHAIEIEDAFNAIMLDGSGAAPVGFVSPWVSDGSGRSHGHLEFLLDESDASAAAGVYLFSLTFGAAGVTPSDPLYFVAGYGLAEPELDEAIESARAWVEANLVPEPASLVLGVLALPVLLGRRRGRD